MNGTLASLAPGLLHWRAAHPDWRPTPIDEGGGWGPEVASYAIRAGDVLVLVDPLLPPPGPARDAVLGGLDVAAADAPGGVAVLRTIGFHTRSIPELVERYAAAEEPPPGVERLELDDPLGDAAVHVPERGALVVGDLVLGSDAIAGEGAPGWLRLCPPGWFDGEDARRWHAEQAPRVVARLAGLEPDHVLVGHGTPVVFGGAAALRALAGLA